MCSPTVSLAPGCQGGIPFSLFLQLPQLAPVGKHVTREKSASPILCFCLQPGYLPDFLTDFIRSLQCLEGNGLAWLHYLEGIPKREFTSGWSRLLSLLVADSCLQITPLDPTSLGGETGDSVFTVCFTLKSTEGKMLIKWLLGSQNMLSFARRCYCPTRRSWGKSSWLTTASALAEIKVVEQKCNSSWWNSVFFVYASSVIVFVIVSGFI